MRPVRAESPPHHRAALEAVAPNDVVRRVVGEHLSEFLDRVRTELGRGPPPFVETALRGLVRCGDFTGGFVRLRCERCRADRIVPFSCKSPLCPSCAGRAMADRAAWLVDRVLRNDIGWRQVVVTFPPELAVGLCFASDSASRVTRVCARSLSEWQRARAACPLLARTASVVWLQRFSDGLGSWFHLHFLVPEGVFVERPGALSLSFEPHPPPTPAEVRELAATVARRVTRLVRRRQRMGDDSALRFRLASQPASLHRGPARPPPSRVRHQHGLCATHQGFSVHAATHVAPNRPGSLERLVRYMARPPVSNQRLHIRRDGRVEVALKRTRRNGVSRLIFEPLAFVARLAALVPPPGRHGVRYYGCLSSASPLRRRAVPDPPDPTPTRPTAPARPQRMPWAALLQRTFHLDILSCPCGGRLRPIAVLTEPTVVQAALAAIIMSQSPPRGPPAHQAVAI